MSKSAHEFVGVGNNTDDDEQLCLVHEAFDLDSTKKKNQTRASKKKRVSEPQPHQEQRMKVMSKPASEFVGVGVNTDDEEEASNIDSENEREHQRQNNMLKMGKRDKKKTKESGEKRNRDTNNNIQCQEQRKQQGEATKSTEDCIENVQHKKRDKRTKNNEGSDTSTTLTTFTVKEGAKNMTVGLSTHCSQVHANQMQLHISNIENELRMARHEITIVKTAIGVLPRFTAHSLVANGLVNADQMGNAESVCSAMTKQALHQSNEGSSPPLNNAYTSGNDLAIVVSKGKGIECPFYTSKKKKSTVLKPKKRAATVNGYNLFVRQKMKTADVMAVNDTSSRMLIIAEAWKKLKEENQEEVKRYAKEAQKINESKKSNCGFSNQDEAHSSGDIYGYREKSKEDYEYEEEDHENAKELNDDEPGLL